MRAPGPMQTRDMVIRRLRIVLSSAGLFVAGCLGSVSDRAPDRAIDPPPMPPPDAVDGLAVTPIRRLTPDEYRRSVEVLVGLDVSAEASSIPRDGHVLGFDNHHTIQAITVTHVLAYQRVAEAAAARVLESPAARSRLTGCDPAAAGEACVREFAARFARRAYRRPPSERELERLLAIARVAPPEPLGFGPIGAILETVLQEPQFILRPEVGVPDTGDGQPRARLSGYEVATRLAFGLWQEPPDDALLDLAAAGSLDTREGVVATARDMLADPRSRAAVRTFVEQWLDLRSLETASFEPTRFPAFNDRLRSAAIEEVRLLATDAFAPGSSVLRLYDSTHGYVDAELAALYGIGGSFGPELTRVELDPASFRGGLFTTAGYAMATSKPHRTSVVHRGLFVRSATLCDAPPPPPPGVETDLPPAVENGEAALGAHLTDAGCRGCHLSMDPIGLGLERYDPIGALRASYADGSALPANGWIEGVASSDFSDGRALGRLVAQNELAPRCVMERYYTWIFGRTLHAADEATLDRVLADFNAASAGFDELVAALVASDVFRYRPLTE